MVILKSAGKNISLINFLILLSFRMDDNYLNQKTGKNWCHRQGDRPDGLRVVRADGGGDTGCGRRVVCRKNYTIFNSALSKFNMNGSAILCVTSCLLRVASCNRQMIITQRSTEETRRSTEMYSFLLQKKPAIALILYLLQETTWSRRSCKADL